MTSCLFLAKAQAIVTMVLITPRHGRPSNSSRALVVGLCDILMSFHVNVINDYIVIKYTFFVVNDY